MADSWAVKYRPQTFEFLTGNEKNGAILRESVKRHQEPPAVFLAGTRGSGKCVSVDTIVLTEEGPKRAGDIFPKGEWKSGEFIDFHCYLVNMWGDLEETSHAYYNGFVDCLKITLECGYSLTCTPNHPILISDDNVLTWVTADLIKSGMFCYVTKEFPFEFNFCLSEVVSVEEISNIETIDFTLPETHSFITNGLVSHNTTSARIYAKAICCEHPMEDGEPCNECESCKDIMNRCHPDVIEVDAASENSVQGIRDLVKTLNYLPTRSAKKVIIIDECLTADTKVLMSDYNYKFISDVKDGDIVIAYDEYTHSLQPAKVSCCIKRESEVVHVHTEFGIIKGSPNHRMLVYRDGQTSYALLSEVQVGDCFVLVDYNGFMKNGPIYEKVVSVELSPIIEMVYDFEVAKYHNFIANGFVSHNCHSLSSAAANALLKTLEEPPEFVRFVFCTTEPQKVLDTIRSRCLQFRFNDITTRDIQGRLRYISDHEQVQIDDAALMTIAKNSNGGMRDAVMLLEQAHLANVSGDIIKPANILELVGSVSVRDIQALFQALKSGNQEQLLSWLDQEKFAPIDILNSSISFLETIVLIKQGVSPAEFVSKDLVSGVMTLASIISFHDVSVMFEEFRGIIYDLRSLNGVSTSALFRLRLLGVIDKLNFVPVMAGGGAPAIQQTFLQKVKSEFNVERIPLPI